MKAVLLYQSGIANVFTVDSFSTESAGRNARRLIQADFGSCESFARGLAAAGAQVRTFSVNAAGDAADIPWTRGTGATPFRDRACAVVEN